MNPADHYHNQFPAPSKDCSNNLFNLNNPYHNHSLSANTSNFVGHNTRSSSAVGPGPTTNLHSSVVNQNTNCKPNIHTGGGHVHVTMGGQTPVFFPPSSFVVASHKSSQDLHEAMLNASKHLNGRPGPLQVVDFKDVIGSGSEGPSGMSGSPSDHVRLAKRPHLRFGSGGQEYDPGPGSARTAGEEMSMDYVDHAEGGEYLDPLESIGDLMKKGSRRLGYDQVKALEKAFEVENRLEPERKVRLASQLGLQPRQVAVWFQNRRARWKTKQMERDYTLLKNKFEALKADRDKLLQEKDHLQAELARLKGHSPPVEGMPESRQDTKGEQDSSTLASCLLVDDATPNPQTKIGSKGPPSRGEDGQLDEEVEDDEELEEDEASPSKQTVHEPKLLQNDSLSSTEDSDINNDGTIVNSSSKAFQEDSDYYTQQWRLPQAPTQFLYKTPSNKNEEWPEHGENMSSFSMHLDNSWYNWGC